MIKRNNIIKRIFSKKIKENGIKGLLFLAAIFGVIVIFSILIFLILEANPLPTDIWSFLSGSKWNPSGEPPIYGMLPLIVGTLLVTLGAMLIAVPLSLGAAIFISEMATPKIRSIIKPAIELLAGIPSVVYGFFGLIILTEFIQENLNPTYGHGETWLAGSIILGIMAIPTITTVAEDAINAVPREYKEGSLAMGATRWQTISRVIVPSALSGITAAIILGIGRAVGETMAVMMVCGNSPIIPEPISFLVTTKQLKV
jgi:phosphate ABC transporter, permease protein PstC